MFYIVVAKVSGTYKEKNNKYIYIWKKAVEAMDLEAFQNSLECRNFCCVAGPCRRKVFMEELVVELG